MTTFLMLPNDLIFNCLARVSRLYYPTISLVSKRLRALLASTELYQTRALMSCTESCLYVCLKLPKYHDRQHWFTLCQRPNSFKKVLVPVTSPNSTPPSMNKSEFARVGSKIYAIGGYKNGEKESSSSVIVMDCRSHTWSDAPSMSSSVARVNRPSACVFDGKIYVVGGCGKLDGSNWMEVFDTKTQTWEFVPSSVDEKFCSLVWYRSFVYDAHVYVSCCEKAMTYKMNKGGRWRTGDLALSRGGICLLSYCVMENVLYSCSRGRFTWYDLEMRCWNEVEGLKNLFSFPLGARPLLADYGGKLAVLWDDNASAFYEGEGQHEFNIFCAVIAIEKLQGETIWGTLEWLDVVFTTNEPYKVAHVVAPTL